MYYQNYYSANGLKLNEESFRSLIERLEVESSEYWQIIEGINNSVDEIIAWVGLVRKVKEIYFELGMHEDFLIQQIIRNIQLKRDKKMIERDWDYAEQNPLKNPKNI
ncbi:uncharacterized protein METZ01_LOCUS223931, partial [marine metagenome]